MAINFLKNNLIFLLSLSLGCQACGFLGKYRKSKSAIFPNDNQVPSKTQDPGTENGIAPATHLSISTQPTSGVVDIDFFGWIEILALNDDGEIDPNFNQEITVSLASGSSNLRGTLQVMMSAGSASFESLSISATGTYALKFESDGVESVTSSSFEIHPQFDGGDGSSWGMAYEIANIYQLQGLAFNVSAVAGSYVLLTSDLDFSESSNWFGGSGFTPIGNSSDSFSGYFDGNRKKISNLYIHRSSEDNIGLFGVGASSCELHKFILVDLDVEGQNNVGGLVGKATSCGVTSVLINGSVVGQSNVGGLSGLFSNSLSSQSFYTGGSIKGKEFVGGVFGYLSTSTNTAYVISDADVSASDSYAGGFAGYTNNASTNGLLSFLFATGYVAADHGIAGGLIGFAGKGSIYSSASTGSVYSGSSGGISRAGGLIGQSSDFKIESSFSDASVYASGSRVGGLVGEAEDQTTVQNISASFATGSVSGSDDVGGLIGYAEALTISYAFASGLTQSGGSHLSGLLGVPGTSSGYSYSFFDNSGGNSALYCAGAISNSTHCAALSNLKHGFFGEFSLDQKSQRFTRVSLADQSEFPISGTCAVSKHGSTVSASFSGGSRTASASALCRAGKWKMNANLSGFSDGSILATFSLGGSSVSQTFSKVTSACSGVSTQVSGFAGGSGAIGDPFLICSYDQFLSFAEKKQAGTSFYFKLGNNIVLDPSFQTPMSTTGGDCTDYFCNELDGDSFSINDLKMVTRYDHNTNIFLNYSSLIGQLGTGSAPARISNLSLKNARVIGGAYTSGLVSSTLADTVIDTSVVEGMIVGQGSNTAGVVAMIEDSSISSSGFIGNVASENAYSGGLAGFVNATVSASVTDCYSEGTLLGYGGYAGGLVGSINHLGISVQTSYSRMNVAGNAAYLGGFVGAVTAGTVSNSYAESNVVGQNLYVGTFAGTINSTVNDSYASGSAAGPGKTGGFSGQLSAAGDVTFGFSMSDYVGSPGDVGGMAGITISGANVDFSSFSNSSSVPASCVGNEAASTVGNCSSAAISGFYGALPGDGGAPVPVKNWGASWVQVAGALPALSWE